MYTLAANIADEAPGLCDQRVPRLQLHYLVVGAFVEHRIGIKSNLKCHCDAITAIVELRGPPWIPCRSFEDPQSGARRWQSRETGYEQCGTSAYLVLEMGNEHAELRAPIANVVQCQHVVSGETQHLGQTVSNDGRPQMAHMHFCRVSHSLARSMNRQAQRA